MPAPRSVRFESATEAALAAFVARHPGLSRSSAAALLVEEGLRMDAHPGVLFRGGPSGRRAVLVGGPDVWEIIRAVASARAAQPTLGADDLIDLVAEESGVSRAMVQAAIDYYASYPDDVAAQVADAELAEAEAEAVAARRRELLGA